MKPHKKTVKNLIQLMLEEKEHLRDSDEALASNILYMFLKIKNIDCEKITAFELLKMYAKNELPTVDYITRVRRKLQEDNENLRGKTYKARKNKEEEVKQNINKNEIDEVL
jgi:hypothetical protein